MSVTLGADFGTTNSCVSYYNFETNDIIVIPNRDGKFTTPTRIDISGEEVLFGDSANGVTAISNIKRLIGASSVLECHTQFNAKIRDNEIVFVIDNNNYTVKDIICMYLRHLINFSLEYLNTTIENIKIVITIPTYYSDLQREILKECCTRENLDVIRIINEPTSAALAYSWLTNKNFLLNKDNKDNNDNVLSVETPPSENVLVLDCGGGTTDLSLVHLDFENQIYEVKNVVGDNFLGGEDLTQLIYNWCISKIKLQLSDKIKDKLRKECERAKVELSFSNTTTIFVDGDIPINIKLSLPLFLDIIRPFFDKIKKLIKNLINDSNTVPISKINSVIFVGGTTRIPYFKDLVKSIFGENIIINNSVDPDQIVSIGASIQGALLTNSESVQNFSEALLLDVIPLSIGIETFGGIFEPLISRNTVLPVSRTREFLNSESYEDSIEINIYQGERKFVKDLTFITKFILTDLPLVEKGELIIKVTFEIDSNSILTASATVSNKKDIDTEPQEFLVKVTKMSVENVNTILDNAEENKILDLVMYSKCVFKQSFFELFSNYLSIFHEKRDFIIQKEGEKSYVLIKLNNVFNKAYNTILNYTEYTLEDLKNAKEMFDTDYHLLLFGDCSEESAATLIE
jgi:molecular chaperone DnaK